MLYRYLIEKFAKHNTIVLVKRSMTKFALYIHIWDVIIEDLEKRMNCYNNVFKKLSYFTIMFSVYLFGLV